MPTIKLMRSFHNRNRLSYLLSGGNRNKRNALGVRGACFVFLLCLATAIISPAQQLSYFYGFHGTDGSQPIGPLVQGFDGNFYGATDRGGALTNGSPYSGAGTLFKLTPKHAVRTLYSFCPGNDCSTGSVPAGGLAQSLDGNFYGTIRKGETATAAGRYSKSHLRAR